MSQILHPVGSVSSVEVKAFCSLWGQSWLPFPLLTNTRATDPEGEHRELTEAIERVRTSRPRELTEWARTSVAPDLRIEAAYGDPRLGTDENSRWRINAVRRMNLGFVAQQKPANSDGTFDDITVYSAEATDLAAAVVAALPPAPEGSLGVIPHTPQSASDRGALKSLSEATVIGSGFVQVREGKFSEWRFDENSLKLFWIDTAEHGRYLRANGLRVPGSSSRMTAEINSLVKTIVQRIKEGRGLYH